MSLLMLLGVGGGKGRKPLLYFPFFMENLTLSDIQSQIIQYPSFKPIRADIESQMLKAQTVRVITGIEFTVSS